MKRNEINQLIAEAIIFFNAMNFKLPPWAYWKPAEWKDEAPLHLLASDYKKYV